VSKLQLFFSDTAAHRRDFVTRRWCEGYAWEVWILSNFLLPTALAGKVKQSVKSVCLHLSFEPTDLWTRVFFTARRYDSAVYAVVVCLSGCVCLSRRYSIKTTKHGITKITPHDSPGTLIFCRQRSRRNSNCVVWSHWICRDSS